MKEALLKVLNQSSIALLVLKGEDQTIDVEMHTHESVTHEVGLFHGNFGFERA
jgi:hypothetical protein